MYKKTFEIFSKFIGRANNITIVFDTNGGACADLENNILHLPKDIANDNAFKALALTMHEAAHIRYSKNIPIKELCPMRSDFEILNAIEDIRIDLKNFNILPNVRAFYQELVKEHLDLTGDVYKDEPIGQENKKKLCAGLLTNEGFRPKLTKEDQDFMKNSKLAEIMMNGTYQLDNKKWKDFRKTIEIIKELLKIDPDKDQPNTETQIRIGKGKGTETDSQGNPIPGQKKAIGVAAGLDGKDPADSDDGEDPWKGIGDGPKMPGGSLTANPLAMEEQCANEFKEILNIKEIKIIHEGSSLDTDNLISYHTGDIDYLFKEDKTIRKKKSKILFLIDGSGSMGEYLIDGKPRAKVVKSSVMKLTQIIDEVRELEGINVDWGVGQFEDCYTSLSKRNWVREYYPNGGTNFRAGFKGAMDEMLADYTIEGKRIIIVFTDGEVHHSEIDDVNKMIQVNHSDVRCLIIGVGSDLHSKFVKELVRDNVIIAEDNAVDIIIQTIRSIL